LNQSTHTNHFLPKVRNALYVWLAVFCGLMSCSREIPLPKSVEIANGSVIHMFLQPDSNIVADCSKVVGILNPFEPESNAKIKIQINASPPFQLNNNSLGIYSNQMVKVKARDTVWVHYTSPTDSFDLTEIVPSNISFIKTDSLTEPVAGIGITQGFKIQFQDSAVDQNYYRIYAKRLIRKYTLDQNNNITDSLQYWETMKIDGNDLPFLRNNYNNYTEQEILFSDETFNGVLATFHFYNLLPNPNNKTEKTLSTIITLENLSKPLYDYYNSRAAHIWSQKSITQLPGPLTGNVPNGYGVIGAFTNCKWVIKYP
jgi:hypothetical protein